METNKRLELLEASIKARKEFEYIYNEIDKELTWKQFNVVHKGTAGSRYEYVLNRTLKVSKSKKVHKLVRQAQVALVSWNVKRNAAKLAAEAELDVETETRISWNTEHNAVQLGLETSNVYQLSEYRFKYPEVKSQFDVVRDKLNSMTYIERQDRISADIKRNNEFVKKNPGSKRY